MTDTKARRVSIHEWKSVPAGTWDDHPSGTHMLVPVEVWEENHDWQCGCGHWNGPNLPHCGMCGRKPGGEDE